MSKSLENIVIEHDPPIYNLMLMLWFSESVAK